MRDLRSVSDDEFRLAIDDFEQDDLERKRNLNLSADGARADFAVLVSGLGNSGGGTIVVGPLEAWTGDEEQRFDPARLSAAAAGVLDPPPGLRVSRRVLSEKTFVLINVAPPRGSYVLRRSIGKYGAGLVPSRVGTATRIATNANELAQLFARWGPNPTDVLSREDIRARYAGRSSDLSLLPDETGTFAVFYLNIGTRTWRSASADEVVLVPSRFEASRGYIPAVLPGGAVARQVQALVEPGQIATFTFDVKVPTKAAGNAFHFLHPEPGGREIGVDVQCVVYVPTMTVRGRVTDALTGAPLDNVCVTVGVPGEWCWTTTNAAGGYVVDLADAGAQPGTDWELFFIRRGYETARSPAIRLPGDLQVMNIQMRRADAGSGAPPAAPVPSKVLNQPLDLQ